MRFDAPHCHWTYTLGRYRSPWYWGSQAEAREAAGEPRDGLTPAVFQVHAADCRCTPPTPQEDPA
jgi:hypothetical protein